MSGFNSDEEGIRRGKTFVSVMVGVDMAGKDLQVGDFPEGCDPAYILLEMAVVVFGATL